jgi:rubrerythrin
LDVDRRRFLQTAGVGFAGGAAMLVAGCGDDKTNKAQGAVGGEQGPVSKPEPAGSDVADLTVLNSALDLEHRAVAAYTAALGALRGENLRTARLFRDQERAHVAALSTAIKGMGGRPNPADRNYRLPRFAGEDEVLRFAIGLENTAIAAYIDAVPRLNAAGLRAEVASILATEAEHLAVLNGALSERSAPTAFVTGQEDGA